MFLVIFCRVVRCLFVGVHDSHDTDIVRCDQLKNKSSRRVTYGNPCYTLARYRFLQSQSINKVPTRSDVYIKGNRNDIFATRGADIAILTGFGEHLFTKAHGFISNN
jgi:hypothetical protein